VAAVQLEAVGDDEQGVDVWVTARDGTRDAQQCKRKNRTAGRWGTGELARQGVLKNLAVQLGRDASARFTFVSVHSPSTQPLTSDGPTGWVKVVGCNKYFLNPFRWIA
jgi:hypothetical protein